CWAGGVAAGVVAAGAVAAGVVAAGAVAAGGVAVWVSVVPESLPQAERASAQAAVNRAILVFMLDVLAGNGAIRYSGAPPAVATRRRSTGCRHSNLSSSPRTATCLPPPHSGGGPGPRSADRYVS